MFAYLDLQMIVYGVLVVCAIIALIITIKPRKQPPFPEWFKEVEKLFYREGYSIGYVEQLSTRYWKEKHFENYTPAEAFYEYFE